jgi:hypothetical protein
MKTKKIIKKMYLAILEHNQKEEKKMWLKAMKKSIKHKNTYAVK